MMRRIVLTLVACCFLAGWIPDFPAIAGPLEKELVATGMEAPLFRTKAVEGEEFLLQRELSTHRYVMINFWGLRCGACIEEIPSLEEAHREFSPRGLSILGVNVDGLGPADLAAQMEKMKLNPPYKILVDEELKIADMFALTGAPLTLIVDHDGKIIYRHEGYEEGDEVELMKVLASLLPKE